VGWLGRWSTWLTLKPHATAQREIEERSHYLHHPGPKVPVTICEDLHRCVVMGHGAAPPRGRCGRHPGSTPSGSGSAEAGSYSRRFSRSATNPSLPVCSSLWRYPTDRIATVGIARKIPGTPASAAPHRTATITAKGWRDDENRDQHEPREKPEQLDEDVAESSRYVRPCDVDRARRTLVEGIADGGRESVRFT
jgi:hypothetical protein